MGNRGAWGTAQCWAPHSHPDTKVRCTGDDDRPVDPGTRPGLINLEVQAAVCPLLVLIVFSFGLVRAAPPDPATPGGGGRRLCAGQVGDDASSRAAALFHADGPECGAGRTKRCGASEGCAFWTSLPRAGVGNHASRPPSKGPLHQTGRMARVRVKEGPEQWLLQQSTAPAIGTGLHVPAWQMCGGAAAGSEPYRNHLPTPARHACAGRGSTGRCSCSLWPTVSSWRARSAAARADLASLAAPRPCALLAPIRVVIGAACGAAGPAEPRGPGMGVHGRVTPAGKK